MGQNSSLKKGLIFHAPLSEWNYKNGAALTSGSLVVGKQYIIGQYNASDDFTNVGAASNAAGIKFYATGTTPTTWTNASLLREINYYVVDEITKSLGTVTSVIPVLGKGGEGRRWYQYDGVDDYTTLPTIPAFGTGDFSVTVKIKTSSLVAANYILNSPTNGFGMYIDTDLKIYTLKTGVAVNTASSAVVVANSICTVSYTRAGSVGTYYYNGVAVGTISDTRDYSVASNKYGTSGHPAEVYMLRIFNYALTPTQVVNYSKPEYPIEWVDRGYGGVLTSGTLVTGKRYKIIDWITNDDFVNVGGANVDGTVFTATGTTPTTWTNSSTVVLLGSVLDLNAEGMGSTYWYDKTNSLTATISGASYIKPVASKLGASYFNGTTSNISFTDADQYTLPNDNFSMVVKINCLDISGFPVILSKNEGGSTREYYMLILPTGKLYIELFDSGGGTNTFAFTSPTSSILINTNYTVGFTYSGGTGNLYINGIAVTTTKTTAGTGFSVFTNISSPLAIGIQGAITPFIGNISDPRLYKRALTAQEHLNYHNGIK